MRFMQVFFAGLSLFFAGASFSQSEWVTFTSEEDNFRVHVPGEFTVEETTWDSEYGAVMPARIYLYEEGDSSYKVTVVDYTDALRIHRERENRTEADYIDVYWEVDVRASVTYAASQIRQRPGEVTYDAYHYIDRVEGEQIQMTYPDQSRLYASIYLHNSKLYIFEATVPPGTPPAGFFQQSLGFVDDNGDRIRYETFAEAPKVADAPDRARRDELRELRERQ